MTTNEQTTDQHYVLDVSNNWRSEVFATRADAQNWIDRYGVSQSYKDEHYSIVSKDEYWKRRNKSDRDFRRAFTPNRFGEYA